LNQDLDEAGRTKITDALWCAEPQAFCGKGQQGRSAKALKRAYK
jgi:hypothetical protein